MKVKLASYKSPIGELAFAFTEEGIIASSLKGKAVLKALLANKGIRTVKEARELPFNLREQLDTYFSGQPIEFMVPLWFAWGTPFQKAVWEAIRAIPYGQTRSYSWLARQVGRPRAFRAVGQAVKANPIPLLVPCHRVVRADGSIGGFTPGLEIKIWLLRLEGALREIRSLK